MTQVAHDIKDITAQVLHDMLTENTGTHMLDSGGSCGRSWQRNQGRAFENEPEVTLNASYDFLDVTINLYHWLKGRLEYNEALDQRFTEFATSEEMDKESWFACADAFMDKLKEEAEDEGAPIGGICGEGEPMSVNTYNHESLLSQVIQYYYWEDEEGGHVLLQIHGGADVRGGYTRPTAFDVDESTYGENCFFDDGRASVYCTDEHAVKDQMVVPGVEGTGYAYKSDREFDAGSCGESWSQCGGYWESSGSSGVDLKDCKIVQHDDELDDETEPKPGDGYIFVDEDGVPHCPICGSPMAASPY